MGVYFGMFEKHNASRTIYTTVETDNATIFDSIAEAEGHIESSLLAIDTLSVRGDSYSIHDLLQDYTIFVYPLEKRQRTTWVLFLVRDKLYTHVFHKVMADQMKRNKQTPDSVCTCDMCEHARIMTRLGGVTPSFFEEIGVTEQDITKGLTLMPCEKEKRTSAPTLAEINSLLGDLQLPTASRIRLTFEDYQAFESFVVHYQTVLQKKPLENRSKLFRKEGVYRLFVELKEEDSSHLSKTEAQLSEYADIAYVTDEAFQTFNQTLAWEPVKPEEPNLLTYFSQLYV